MATIANWNGHTFQVSPKLIRSFTDFSIKGSCETTTKNSEKQKYEEHKYGESPQIGMVISLNAMTGVTDVYSEALEFVREATEGACAYFYMGTKKLIPAKVILVNAEVTQVVHMPGEGCKWISCDVKVSFKQGTKNDGGKNGGSGGSGGSNKVSVKTTGVKNTGRLRTYSEFMAVHQVTNKLVEAAKKASQTKKVGLQAAIERVANARATLTSSSNTKIGATTSRSSEITTKKITRVSTSQLPRVSLH